MQNKTILLGFVAVLLVIKFAVVPLIDWQDSTAATVHRQAAQLEKGKRLLANQEDIAARVQALEALRETLQEGLVFSAEDQTSLQIELQSFLGKRLEEYGLEARNINWLNSLSKGPLVEQRVELSLSGKLHGLISFMLDVEQFQPRMSVVRINTINSNMYPQRQTLGQFNGMVVLSMMRNAGTSGETDEQP
ncbi:hypothetical protein LJ739_00985 [Aestuariibacter halophilus]|uniref:Uncharacterized protein n=1 Tax=Fluctibacter halophilus TaxID=226011 RepID=A0ABS8G3Y1_9ALTE|nr:hypothetical protein [Aestuariibacter halophilus]MCC2614811.1 hypothetical protein [Aestuariibacter halophilus]